MKQRKTQIRHYILFYEILNGVLSRNAPIKHKRIKSYHLPKWFNDEIKKAMCERDRFHKLKDWENYKRMRNKTLHLIRKSKKNYYNTAIQKGTNSKDLWKNFRKKKKKQNNDNDITELSAFPPRIKYNGVEVEDTRSILNCLKDHFINIAKIVNKSEFDENSFSYVHSYLQNKLKNQVFDVQFITPFEVSEIQKLRHL